MPIEGNVKEFFDTADRVYTVGDKFKYKDKEYGYLMSLSMKNPVTRQWVEAVVYYNSDGTRFCRESNEFFKLFEKI